MKIPNATETKGLELFSDYIEMMVSRGFEKKSQSGRNVVLNHPTNSDLENVEVRCAFETDGIEEYAVYAVINDTKHVKIGKVK